MFYKFYQRSSASQQGPPFLRKIHLFSFQWYSKAVESESHCQIEIFIWFLPNPLPFSLNLVLEAECSNFATRSTSVRLYKIIPFTPPPPRLFLIYNWKPNDKAEEAVLRTTLTSFPKSYDDDFNQSEQQKYVSNEYINRILNSKGVPSYKLLRSHTSV